MGTEPLWKISVSTAPEAEDAVAEMLNAVLGVPGVIYRDVESGGSTVTVFLQKKPALPRELHATVSAGLKRINQCGLETGSGRIKVGKVRREDWAESWKRHFKPIEIGDSLLVKPSWSRRKARKGEVVVTIDPGMSFGTGHHPTTAFCLSEIVRSTKRRRANRTQILRQPGMCGPDSPRSFLDIGTGSGILAIAAAKSGYSPVHAFDFDPDAIGVARANARANRVDKKLRIWRGDVSALPICPRQKGQRYDLVCANLISDLLIAERRRIVSQLNDTGTLVLAGILKLEFNQVRTAYENLGLKLVRSHSEKEWRSGAFRPIGKKLNAEIAIPV